MGETTNSQGSGEESGTFAPLFDPSTTVTLPDPPSGDSSHTHEPSSSSLAPAAVVADDPASPAGGISSLRPFYQISGVLESLNVSESCTRMYSLFNLCAAALRWLLAGFHDPQQHRKMISVLVVILLLFLDPWQARGAYERPAYEAFLRRQNLLRFSTADIIDGVLTYYLSIYTYL